MTAAWIQVPAVVALAFVSLTAPHWAIALAAMSALILAEAGETRGRLLAFVIVLVAFVLLGHGHWTLGLLALVALLFLPNLPPNAPEDAHDDEKNLDR